MIIIDLNNRFDILKNCINNINIDIIKKLIAIYFYIIKKLNYNPFFLTIKNKIKNKIIAK